MTPVMQGKGHGLDTAGAGTLQRCGTASLTSKSTMHLRASPCMMLSGSHSIPQNASIAQHRLPIQGSMHLSAFCLMKGRGGDIERPARMRCDMSMHLAHMRRPCDHAVDRSSSNQLCQASLSPPAPGCASISDDGICAAPWRFSNRVRQHVPWTCESTELL